MFFSSRSTSDLGCNFVLGCDPPPTSICIMNKGRKGGYTPFWNYSEGRTPFILSLPLGGHTPLWNHGGYLRSLNWERYHSKSRSFFFVTYSTVWVTNVYPFLKNKIYAKITPFRIAPSKLKLCASLSYRIFMYPFLMLLNCCRGW